MSPATVAFAPLVPLWLLAALAAVALLLVGLALWRRARGVWWRALVFALTLLFLAGPVLKQETREVLSDQALVVVDRSASMDLAERAPTIEPLLAELRGELEGFADVEQVEVTLRDEREQGTQLEGQLRAALADLDPSRLAAVMLVTDGQMVDDSARLAALAPGAPLHVLLAGRPDERDRRLRLDQVPSYAMVDERQELVVRVDDLPGAAGGAPVPLRVRQNDQVIYEANILPGEARRVPFTLERAGPSVLEVEAGGLDGEIATQNNRAVAFVNGVRDRLRVLLVSGQPSSGLRVWRNLLKSDPAVDLVHFTILRPPEKQDGTPIQELALIAFPSRELFEVKLHEFDLIIFDRYSRRGLLPLAYLDNVARYVEDGGALLEAAGPEFAEPLSLYRTPLARVLPGRPSGRVFEQGFLPEITQTGRRHPVTTEIAPPPGGEPDWGRWFRQVDVELDAGEVLMRGVSDRPLLVLNRVGDGRVAQLLSDQAWLWARGYEGGGPQNQLLRRLVHWLMQEPELEEEALEVEPAEDGLVVRRRSIDQPTAREVEIEAPSGATRTVTLEPHEDDDGLAEATVPADEPGVYRVRDGELIAFAAVRPISARERADLRATDAVLAPMAEATGGGVVWLGEDGLPDLRRVGDGRAAHGRGWIGLERNERYRVLDTAQLPLLPAWLALSLLLGTLAAAWWREGR